MTALKHNPVWTGYKSGMQIQDPPPQHAAGQSMTPYERLGGEAAVQRLVDRFYDLMELEPAYRELRATHTDMERARQHLFWFLCGWLGGPQHYVERFGHPRLKMRHMPFKIGVRERDQWVVCMDQAMRETNVPQELINRLNQSFFQTADWMRNQPGA